MASLTPTSTSSTTSKPPRILACVLCQHRKIKCDRTFPCSNCVKANVKCTPSTPAPVRKRRRPNQDLQERLARCEELLKEYATEKPDEPSPRPAQQPPSAFQDPYLQFAPAGKLIQEDGGVRFMDSFLLGTIYDELRAMREIVDAEDSPEDLSTEATSPDENSELLLGGGDTPRQTVEELQPDPGHIFRLWQVFLDRVNPLTKIIHVPSVQPYLVEATSGSPNIPKSMEALLFSIYLLAALSLSADECQSLLGYSREKALQRFSAGVRLSLVRMGFLKSHDLVTIQAMVIYLLSLQGRYNRHAAWVLNGVVIRMAQKMGLHRDGESLNLSPFETEMRRRVWWQIIMVDAKYAMLSGMSHSLLPRSWDTKAPKNVNDADMFPSATEPIQDREGPTEMIFCLITYRIAKFLVQFPGFETVVLLHQLEGIKDKDHEPNPVQMAEFRKLLETLTFDLLQALDKYCDPSAGPLHEMAMGMKTHILEKLNELVKTPHAQPEWGNEIRTPQDNAFKISVTSTEHNTRHYYQTRDNGFLWFTLMHFQVDLFVYMVAQLCFRTDGQLVERAWVQVDAIYEFHHELFDVSNKTNFLLAQYLLKAWRKREQVLAARAGGQAPETPEYVVKLRREMPQEDSKGDSSSAGTPSTPASQQTQPQRSLMGSSPADGATAGGDASVDQLLGGYLDISALDWDMWGGVGTPAGGSAGMAFGSFGVGPSTEW